MGRTHQFRENTATAHYQGVETVYTHLSEFTKNKGSELNTTFKHYQDSADRFMASAKKLRREVVAAKDGVAKTKAVDKAFDTIIRNYNTLVSYHNALTQLEQVDKLN